MIPTTNRFNVRFYNIPIDDRGGSYGGGYGGSRDFVLPTIPCAVACCPCNKRGKCEMPSRIEIGPDGACRFGKVAMELDRREKGQVRP